VYVAIVVVVEPDWTANVTLSNPSKFAVEGGVIVSTLWFSLIRVVIAKPLWFEAVEPPASGMSGMSKVNVTIPCGTVIGGPAGTPGTVCPSGCVKTMDGSSARAYTTFPSQAASPAPASTSSIRKNVFFTARS
jgi:hypothetical protein